MPSNELTISEVLHDPLIRLMLRADRVPLRKFKKLLMEAAADARNKGAISANTPPLPPRQ
ncbi:hypothetical protein [Rhizobium sp. P38BS-XIX]|uniref:hypothetical protein n=1 Tax=Rhizobium sp. P38BS-XIX TaxID=2726740 RepID=UPI0032B10A11